MPKLRSTPWRGTLWEGLRLARHRIGPDPDSPPRPVALPLGWEEEAAAALAALRPGQGPVSLPRAAEAWIQRALQRGSQAGLFDAEGGAALAEGLRALLLMRRAAPGAEVWRGERAEPRFVLHLPAFLEPEGGFDCAGYAEAVALGVRFLEAIGGARASRLRLGFADLAGLLAALGLPYDSAEARAVAAGIAALTRGAAEAESGRIAARLGAREPVALLWPAPPEATVLPGLAQAARAALDAAAASPGLRHAQIVVLSPADAAEALLGAETAGISPAAGATRPVATATGAAEVPTRAALAAARFGPARAAQLLAPVGEGARRAMAEAVLPFLHAAPPAPLAPPAPPRPVVLRASPPGSPARRGGLLRHASVGGHRVALRASLDEKGRLAALALEESREGAAYRALLEAFARAVSIGLQHGAPLSAYVEAFAYSRVGAAGAVEGDDAIARASSVLDWAFRRLARDVLGRGDLPDPAAEDCRPETPAGPVRPAPSLPLDLPEPAPGEGGRRRGLRVVA
ncbi:MAG: hypothetical protein NZN45_02595 [Rhodovarius sp.]|nr:hypothetical protein [Rhodovarius sp.]